MSEFTPFFVDRAKGGRASCKGCKSNCPGGELRLAKVVASPYGENQTMKSWHHVDCFMNALLKQRPTTKRIDSTDDIGNWQSLTKEDQEFLLKKINEMEKLYAEKNSGKYTAKEIKNVSDKDTASISNSSAITSDPKSAEKPKKEKPVIEPVITKDNKFYEFAKLCKLIAKYDAYTDKTAEVNAFFRRGTGGTFQGDLALWCKLLLPQVSKRVYNLKSKQLVKLFSRIFNTDHDDMLTSLEQGDVANTISHFFSHSKTMKPASTSTLTIQDVENFLEDLSKFTKEEDQIYHFKKIIKKCTLEDLRMIIRLIKGDLRINAGPKHILEGIHPDAYKIFQTARDLDMVIDRVVSNSGVKHKDTQTSVNTKLVLMTPVLPMLAEACKSVEMAMKKCPNGMFSEIKYDGERVQVHKQGNDFRYFSRALKPVMAHKVSHFKDYLPKAFPEGTDLVLDAEVLMIDTNTGKPLPFGTLGIHKQSEFKDAQVCLFVFDCLYYNGKVLLDVPIWKRRDILFKNMVEVQNHVMLSEQELIKKPADLAKMIAKVLQLGLEGLVLKDLQSTYKPGKRHWLKVKKDYLFDGAMADTADLVVLGAWFGTGKKGGMMSVFLMGCLDKRRNKWLTVTKVHTGHDDSTLERLQRELAPLMVKISGEYSKVPSWLECNKGMVPDFVALDPKKQPVWEITGTELTKANLHTADGISVRFPRVTRIRDDKNWESATNLEELKHLYKTSKEKTDVSLLDKLAATAAAEESKDKHKAKPNQDKEDTVKQSSKKLKDTSIDRFLIKPQKKDDSNSSLDNTITETDGKKEKASDKSKSSISSGKSSEKDSDKSSSSSTSQRHSKDRHDRDRSGHKKDKSKDQSERDRSEYKKDKPRKTEHESKDEKERKRRHESKRDEEYKERRKHESKESSSSSSEKDRSKKIKKDKHLDSSSESIDNKEKANKRKRDEIHQGSESSTESKHKKDRIKKNERENRDNTSKTDYKVKEKIKKEQCSPEKDERKRIDDHTDKRKRSKTEDHENSSSETKHKTKKIKKEHSPQTEIPSEMNQDSNSSSDTIIDDTDYKEVLGAIKDVEYGPELQKHPENPLPDVFLNKRLGFFPDFISFPEDMRDVFERHWVAYGGIVEKSIHSKDVDYVLHNEDVVEFEEMLKLKKRLPQGVKHVAKDWLIMCINEVKLCDTELYPVYVKPGCM